MELQYMIAKGSSTEKLWAEVESRIKEGWIPQGGISVANGTNFIYAQALIKKLE